MAMMSADDEVTEQHFVVPEELLEEIMPERESGRDGDPLVEFLKEELTRGRESRDELTKTIGLLDTHADARHAEMMNGLRDLGNAIDKNTTIDQWKGKIAGELWSMFKMPLGGLITAAAAYMGWRYMQIPVTPTPVKVEIQDQGQ